MPEIIVQIGDKILEKVEIKKDLIEIGRYPDNDVVIDDEEISRRHAQIKKEGENYYIIDLNSQNGVYLNDRRIQKSLLRHNDIISLGKYNLLFKFEEGKAQRMEAKTKVREIPLESRPSASRPEAPSTAPPPDERTRILRSPTIMGRFIIESGKERGKEFVLSDGVTIGRDKDNDIVLDDPHASGKHAKISIKNGITKIVDLGSTNGTLVNGKNVDTKTLKSGDKVQIGKTILKFESAFAEEEEEKKMVIPTKERRRVYYYLGAAAVIIIAFLLFINPFKTSDYEQKIAQATEAINQGQFQLATQILTDLINENPEDENLYKIYQQAQLGLESKKLYEQAAQAFAEGEDIRKIKELLKEAQTRNQRNPQVAVLLDKVNKIEPLLEQGKNQLAINDLSRAEISLFKVLEFQPLNKEAISKLLEIGSKYEQERKIAKAKSLYEKITRYDSKNQYALAKLDQLQRRIVKASTTTKSNRKIAQLTNQLRDAWNLEEYDRAYLLARDILNLDPQNKDALRYKQKIEERFTRAIKDLYLKGDFKKAQTLIKDLQKHYPEIDLAIYLELIDQEKNAFTTMELGKVYRHQKDFPKALEAFNSAKAIYEKILAVVPDNERVKNKLKECDEAINALTKGGPLILASQISEETLNEVKALWQEAEKIEQDANDFGNVDLTPAIQNWKKIMEMLPPNHEFYKKAEEKIKHYSQ